MRTLGMLLGLMVASAAAPRAWAGGADPLRATPAAFLFQIAMQYHDRGQEAEAIHELHKLLIISPNFPGARERYVRLSQRHALREAVIDAALDRLAASVR